MSLLKEVKEDLEEFFSEFYDRIKGRKDVKSRVAVLANPDNPKTMSILTTHQAKFVRDAYWISGVEEWGKMFDGLKDYAGELLLTNMSIGGKRSEQVIQFIGALSEVKMLGKLGVTLSGEQREGKKK